MEDEFEKGLVTGVVFVVITSSYDAVSHRTFHENTLQIADATPEVCVHYCVTLPC